MCVLSIKVPIQKKSGNLLYAPRTCYLVRKCYLSIIFSKTESRKQEINLLGKKASMIIVKHLKNVESNIPSWNENFESRTWPQSWRLFSLSVCNICNRVCLSTDGLASHLRFHDNNCKLILHRSFCSNQQVFHIFGVTNYVGLQLVWEAI